MIKPSGSGLAGALAARLLAFADRYNTTARPFDWKSTRAGLNDARPGHGAVALAA